MIKKFNKKLRTTHHSLKQGTLSADDLVMVTFDIVL